MLIRFNNKPISIKSKTSQFITAKLLPIARFFIAAKANDTSLGSVTGSGNYKLNTEVELKAVPSTIGKFVQWSDGYTSSTRVVIADSNKEYTAIFDNLFVDLTYDTNW